MFEGKLYITCYELNGEPAVEVSIPNGKSCVDLNEDSIRQAIVDLQEALK
jgi:hypothetical protein